MNSKSRASRFVVAIVAAITLVSPLYVSTVMTAGCASVQSFFKDPTKVATFVQYVQTFLQSAATIWNVVAPLLGSNQAVATTQFNNAVFAANQSLAVFQDAVNGVNALTPDGGAPPDIATLFANVQDAVNKVMAVVNQYKASVSIGASEQASELQHQCDTIVAWKAVN